MPKCVIVCSDSKVYILRLFKIIEARLNKAIEEHQQQLQLQSLRLAESIGKFARECLKNLVTYQCFTSEQFIYALASIEHYIHSQVTNQKTNTSSQLGILPIFVDTINSTYEFVDKYNRLVDACQNYDQSEKNSIALIKRLVDRYNVCVLQSRSEYFVNKVDSLRGWQAILSKRVELSVKEIAARRGNTDHTEKEEGNEVEEEDKEELANEEEEEEDLDTGVELFIPGNVEDWFELKLIEFKSIVAETSLTSKTNKIISTCLFKKTFEIKNQGFQFK